MLAQRIQKLLDINKRTATDLAVFVGVSPQAAHGWLAGSEPRGYRKERIAAFFGLTRQELEYAPVLSLNHIPKRLSATDASPAFSEQAADLMIEKSLHGMQRSMEYRQGMRDKILELISGQALKQPFQAGSCFADAYEAGISHAERLFSESEST